MIRDTALHKKGHQNQNTALGHFFVGECLLYFQSYLSEDLSQPSLLSLYLCERGYAPFFVVVVFWSQTSSQPVKSFFLPKGVL